MLLAPRRRRHRWRRLCLPSLRRLPPSQYRHGRQSSPSLRFFGRKKRSFYRLNPSKLHRRRQRLRRRLLPPLWQLSHLLSLLRLPPWVRFALGAALLWLFVDITGASPSAVRAFADKASGYGIPGIRGPPISERLKPHELRGTRREGCPI